MNRLIGAFTVLLLTVTVSCKKDMSTAERNQAEHEKAFYRVLALGKTPGDTSRSSSMYARVETVGLPVAEDSKLRAELIGYQKINGQGVYTITVTNKQNCQIINRWGWEGLTIDAITPASDVIPANGVKTYVLTGDAVVGKIKVKAEGPCGNSSTLIINITAGVLPINFSAVTATYLDQLDKVNITFTIDDPAKVEWIVIQKLTKQNTWAQAMLIGCDQVTKHYAIKL